MDSRDATLFLFRSTQVTAEELAKHCTEDDLWMAVQGKVYNVTPYVP
jgi:cytochrome b involved in lipid metabolism